jgi:oligopeptidase A
MNSAMLRQLYLGQLDMELHHRYDPSTSSETPFDIQKKVAAKYLVVQPLPEDRFLCAFTHILGGGYAAGIYVHSYSIINILSVYQASVTAQSASVIVQLLLYAH